MEAESLLARGSGHRGADMLCYVIYYYTTEHLTQADRQFPFPFVLSPLSNPSILTGCALLYHQTCTQLWRGPPLPQLVGSQSRFTVSFFASLVPHRFRRPPRSPLQGLRHVSRRSAHPRAFNHPQLAI